MDFWDLLIPRFLFFFLIPGIFQVLGFVDFCGSLRSFDSWDFFEFEDLWILGISGFGGFVESWDPLIPGIC